MAPGGRQFLLRRTHRVDPAMAMAATIIRSEYVRGYDSSWDLAVAACYEGWRVYGDAQGPLLDARRRNRTEQGTWPR